MKTWETPKLIILMRNNPQEVVLSFCKGNVGALVAGSVPGSTYSSCQVLIAAFPPTPCTNCSAVDVS